MADIYHIAKRSAIMSRVRGTGNRSTELRLIQIFRSHSLVGWRRSAPLPGRPDFIFRRQRVALFVDGCFWHGCPKHGSQPKSNREFWKRKLARNIIRDRTVNRELGRLGWRVVRIWQHELGLKNESRCVTRLRRVLALPAYRKGVGKRKRVGEWCCPKVSTPRSTPANSCLVAAETGGQ